jgi:hypothetical protein
MSVPNSPITPSGESRGYDVWVPQVRARFVSRGRLTYNGEDMRCQTSEESNRPCCPRIHGLPTALGPCRISFSPSDSDLLLGAREHAWGRKEVLLGTP